jgi:hypothetical protein
MTIIYFIIIVSIGVILLEVGILVILFLDKAKTHNWNYSDSRHRCCKKCGQKQFLYQTHLTMTNEREIWVGDEGYYATSVCSTIKEQDKIAQDKVI